MHTEQKKTYPSILHKDARVLVQPVVLDEDGEVVGMGIATSYSLQQLAEAIADLTPQPEP